MRRPPHPGQSPQLPRLTQPNDFLRFIHREESRFLRPTHRKQSESLRLVHFQIFTNIGFDLGLFLRYPAGMSIFLSYKPSLSLWLAPPETHEGTPYIWPPKPLRSLPSDFHEKPSRSEIAHAHELFASPDGKVHIVSGRKESRKRCALASTMVWPGAIAQSFQLLGSGIYISSPEACFAQVAATPKDADLGTVLRAVKLAELSYMLCGTYALCPGFSCQYGRSPLTSVAKLKKHLLATNVNRGINLAIEVLDRTLPNSASPQETKIAILFSFPRKWGGFNNPPTSLNREITTDRRRGGRLSSKYKCDLFWEIGRGIGLEYKGVEYHSGSSALQNDLQRERELSNQGIQIINMGKRQTESPLQLLEIGELVGKLTGRRLRLRGANSFEKLTQLWRCLYARSK